VVGGRPPLRSVHRECEGRVIEPRNLCIAGAVGLFLSGGHTGAPLGRGAEVPPGSESTAYAQKWGPQEPGRPGRLLLRTGSGRRNKGPGSRGTGVRVRESEARAQRGYRQAKATKRGGTDDRESERLTVPTKPGNSLQGTRPREGGAGSRDRSEERCQEHRVLSASQRNSSG
jgi:hypothetical protein